MCNNNNSNLGGYMPSMLNLKGEVTMYELQNRIKMLRIHYASKQRKVGVKLVGKPYEYDHFQGKALVQDYKLSTGARVYSEFVILNVTD